MGAGGGLLAVHSLSVNFHELPPHAQRWPGQWTFLGVHPELSAGNAWVNLSYSFLGKLRSSSGDRYANRRFKNKHSE